MGRRGRDPFTGTTILNLVGVPGEARTGMVRGEGTLLADGVAIRAGDLRSVGDFWGGGA